jgi:hypothetical protein
MFQPKMAIIKCLESCSYKEIAVSTIIIIIIIIIIVDIKMLIILCVCLYRWLFVPEPLV